MILQVSRKKERKKKGVRKMTKNIACNLKLTLAIAQVCLLIHMKYQGQCWIY
jgi:hypothetical protein